ncbi:MAG: ATP-binding protein [candidate division Zixibacteria bacterium]|nr:ATP-binding protein [candidate division Zixibacteria bacterium]
MKKKLSNQIDEHISNHKLTEDFRVLSHRILLYANRGLPRVDFMREVSKMLSDFSGCDAAELRLIRRDKCYCFETKRSDKRSFRFEIIPCAQNKSGKAIPCGQDDSGLERLCRDILLGHFDFSLPFFTKNGSFWTGNVGDSGILRLRRDRQSEVRIFHLDKEYRSLAIFPLVVDRQNIGLLQLKSGKKHYFTEDDIKFYEILTQTLVVALAHRSAQVGLRERIKELTCLYGIAQLAVQPDISLERILQDIVELLPPAWLYPEIASARIILDGRQYSTSRFREGRQKQMADIVVSGERRGVVEVIYSKEKPELDDGPFLKEERSLIDTVAREVGIIIEHKLAEEEKAKLQNQLMHADRLATIGQLAAGVAHELNEPLGNILGFVQLAKKCPELPKQAEQDIEKAVIASLHAREVVKKLMLFARKVPPKKTEDNLNQLVEEGLYFLESRCAKEGIKLVRSLSPELPEIIADPSQLTQVLVNLVVNAIQAMPEGGKLTVQTLANKGYVSLVVENTGIGMNEEVMKKIFIPFFTTKDIDQGTGLGLPVVQGIVASHGGCIKVSSKPGRGARFEVRLPLTGAPDVEEDD